MAEVSMVALIKAKVGKEKEVEKLLEGLVAPTHAEKGCVKYLLHRAAPDSRMFVFFEKWASQEALQAHFASAHVAEALALKDELLDDFQAIPLVPLEKYSKKGEW